MRANARADDVATTDHGAVARADAAPHAPAADSWPFAGANVAPYAHADNTWSFARANTAPHIRADDAKPFAGADARADAISNSGQGRLVGDARRHRRD